jgi:PAS domain S-box-containing protein
MTGDLRKRAEEKLATEPELLDDLSPEQVRELVHELRTHQIELELQNEELRQAQEDLTASRDRYGSLYDFAPVGYVTLGAKGIILEANLTFAGMFGVTRNEVIGRPLSVFVHADSQATYYKLLGELTTGQGRHSHDLHMRHGAKDDVFWVRIECDVPTVDAGGCQAEGIRIRCVLSDISVHKRAEAQRTVTARILRLVSSPNESHVLLRPVTTLLRDWARCDAVGIRLREGEDFPYFETSGFPATFVQKENRLCAADADAATVRDSDGNPVLECMCGNVIAGRTDPSKPFFTEFGSFWTNSTSGLLASTSVSDRQTRTRNRCLGKGYESVALVPLRVGGETFGLVQFNDRRGDRFTPEKIAFLETVATHLATGLSHRSSHEALRRSERNYRELAGNIPGMVHRSDSRWRPIVISGTEEICGCRPEDFLSGNVSWVDLIHPDDRSIVLGNAQKIAHGPLSITQVYRITASDGSVRWVEDSKSSRFTPEGVFDGVDGVVFDVTERRRTQEALQ